MSQLLLVDDKVIDQIKKLPSLRMQLFRDIDVSEQGTVLLRLSKAIRARVIEDLSNAELISALNHLDPDKATDILQELKPYRRKKITAALSEAVREKVEVLLSFNPKTAAGLMNLDYVIVGTQDKVADVSKDLAEHEKRTGKFPSILVVDNGKLKGEIQGHELAIRRGSDKIEGYIKSVPALRYDSDERKVINSFVRHPHNKVVVLDEDESVLGVIHSDDLLALMDRRTASDLYGLAGVNKEEDAKDGVFLKVKNRYIWLIINLGTAFLAASVVGMFESTISRLTLLAVYMPIVAGMGGNAATQTLAVTVRGLVLHELDLKSGLPFILKEVGAGVINGVINGVIVALVAIFVNKNPLLGLVLAIAMVSNLFIAGFFGALIPMIMRRLGKDPATSATIFITTCTDVGGFFIFLSLAQLLIK